jgi:hypothetical protein
MKIPTRIAASAAICLMLLGALSDAAEPATTAPDNQSQAGYCLRLMAIDDSRILDSQHMLFTTKDKRLYINTFPVECPGMRPGDTYTFRTSLNRLCNQDVITILRPGGHYFIAGVSCGIGMFEEVTQQQVDALKQEIKAKKMQ